MSEEKSIAAELKDILDVAVAQKADKSDLEGMAKSADLEGVVKSSDLDEVKAAHEVALEAAKTEIREEMEAKFAAVPALHEEKSMEPVASFAKHVSDTGEITNRKTLIITKAPPVNPVGSQESTIPGSRVGVNPLYREMELVNPFRPFSTIMPVSTSSFKLPDFNGAQFISDNVGSLPLGTVNETLPASVAQLQSRTVNTERWTSHTQIARPTLDDIENIRGFVSSTIVDAYSKQQGFDAKLVLETALDADPLTPVAVNVLRAVAQQEMNVLEVEVGDIVTAGATPADDNIFNVLDNLIQNTNHAYRPGGVFHMTSQMASIVQRATSGSSSGFEFDPVERVNRLWGYQVQINDYLDAPAIGGIAAYFGTMSRSLVLAEQQNLVIDEYDQTVPGYNTYYAHGRFKNVIWDYAGMSGMRVIANA